MERQLTCLASAPTASETATGITFPPAALWVFSMAMAETRGGVGRGRPQRRLEQLGGEHAVGRLDRADLHAGELRHAGDLVVHEVRVRLEQQLGAGGA